MPVTLKNCLFQLYHPTMQMVCIKRQIFVEGFIPTTDLSRHASSVARFMLRYLMAPMFKLAKITRTVDHGSKMIVDLSISEKYKGM